MDCIFCKIINNDIPSFKIYEDNHYLAFLDIRPLNPGHTLIIPKQHIRWVWDSKDIQGYYAVVQKVANAIRKTFEIEQVVSLVFGEEVHHAHVWLVPRLENDGHGLSIDLSKTKEISTDEMQEIAENIKKNIN